MSFPIVLGVIVPIHCIVKERQSSFKYAKEKPSVNSAIRAIAPLDKRIGEWSGLFFVHNHAFGCRRSGIAGSARRLIEIMFDFAGARLQNGGAARYS